MGRDKAIQRLYTLVLLLMHLSKKMCSNSLQSLLWPGSEPVNGNIIDKSRKISAPVLQSFSNRAKQTETMEETLKVATMYKEAVLVD